jgi:hypothetical protein
MGNAESQDPGDTSGHTGSGEMRRCYYEVLQVERSDSTTADDIKKVRRPRYPKLPPALVPWSIPSMIVVSLVHSFCVLESISLYAELISRHTVVWR